VAEALDEEFLHASSITLQDTQRVGGFAALDRHAANAGAVTDLKEWETVFVDKAGPLRAELDTKVDSLALAGEGIFLKSKTEEIKLRGIADISDNLAIDKTEFQGVADGFFPIDDPRTVGIAAERAQALQAG
jgi:hypothetical protein